MVVVHLLPGLRIGGLERGVLQLASRGLVEGHDHRIVLFDRPPATEGDFDPGQVPVTFLPRRPGFDWHFPFRLARLLREWDACVVHSRNETALFYAAAALRLTRKRLVHVATFDSYPSHPTGAARLLSRWAGFFADRVTAVSPELQQRLLHESWVGRCTTVWNGVDTQRFTPCGAQAGLRAHLGLSPGDILIGNLARLDPIKRHVDLIEAAHLLSSDPEMPAFHVVIVGSGPAESALRKAAKGCAHVTILASRDNAAEMLRAMDLFVLCSEHEGTPRVILEAMAVGIPVVATAVGGIPDLLAAGTCGYLAPPGQASALSEIIKRAAISPAERQQYARLARERVLDYFSAEKEWSEYHSLYESSPATPES